MSTEESHALEAEVRHVIEGFADAVRAKNIRGIESVFSPEIVSFDLVPPLQERGADVFFRRWRDLLDSFEGPIGFELRELSITAAGEVAFSHCLNRMTGKTKDGRSVDRWLRWTACFQNRGGKWLIVHEHVSVPADLKTGKAAVDLKP